MIPTKVTNSLSDISLSEETIFRKLLALNGAPGPDALHPHLLCSLLNNTTIFIGATIFNQWIPT